MNIKVVRKKNGQLGIGQPLAASACISLRRLPGAVRGRRK